MVAGWQPPLGLLGCRWLPQRRWLLCSGPAAVPTAAAALRLAVVAAATVMARSWLHIVAAWIGSAPAVASRRQTTGRSNSDLTGLDCTSCAAGMVDGGSSSMTSSGREACGHGRARHVAFLLGKTRRARARRWIDLWRFPEELREVTFQLIHRLQNLLPQGRQVFWLELMARRARRLPPGSSSSSIFLSRHNNISCRFRLRSCGLS